MTRFGKFPVLIFLVFLAAVSAAIFGALHNQLSFSVGPSYFEELKFPQFGIASDTAPRAGAAIVGLRANWWAGALMALPALGYGFLAVPRPQTYLAAGIGAIGLVLVLATMAALIGLVGGIAADATGILDPWLNPPEGPARSDFLRAGFMHDALFVTGFLGALVAFWPMTRARKIDIAQLTPSRKSPSAP